MAVENKYLGMNILFLLGRFTVGGVERVTVVLANELARRGRKVVIAAFRFENRALLADLDENVKVVELPSGRPDWTSTRVLRRVLKENAIGTIINQWCVPFRVTLFCRWAARGLGVKLLAVHHNMPTTNKRIQDATGVRRTIWRAVTAVDLRLVYVCSDAYVLLSDTFAEPFRRFVRLRSAPKVKVITNPLTMTPVVRDKENIILFVGRLEETQKRFSRVLDIWRTLSHELPDWRLEVVGDGPDRERYEKSNANLERVAFRGFQNPADFYARAQILLMTSDFEGFALTPVEAMASRCVPIVLGSYPAAYDLTREGVKIVLDAPFRKEAFVATVLALARDSARLAKAQDDVRQIAAEYDVAVIADKWERVLS